jgi:hypothetical protein
MSRTDSMLVPSDEGFNHQIADTFAAVLQSDRSWTEKVCGSIFKKDGSLQIGWGIGKYLNRNVMDGYAGVSRGVEQWTVRASRILFPTPDVIGVGPIHYEVLEPLKKIRIRLDENDTQPIAFDIVLDGSVIPPFLENHEFRRQTFGFRTETDLCRYHQVGTARGWLKIDGVKHDINPDDWCMTRDHSWGVRYGVGNEPLDLMPGIDSSQLPMHFLWSPMRFVKPDGSQYSLHHFYLNVNFPGFDPVFHGGEEKPDGTRISFKSLTPELVYDSNNRRLKGGLLHFMENDDSKRTLKIEVVSDTGFHLGTGLYFGYKGFHHGSWRGELHVDGEYIADCSVFDTAKDIHQIRDCIIKITDGDNIGWGNYQTIILGEWPDLQLTKESNFI